jgi:hypothetical protein
MRAAMPLNHASAIIPGHLLMEVLRFLPQQPTSQLAVVVRVRAPRTPHLQKRPHEAPAAVAAMTVLIHAV